MVSASTIILDFFAVFLLLFRSIFRITQHAVACESGDMINMRFDCYWRWRSGAEALPPFSAHRLISFRRFTTQLLGSAQIWFYTTNEFPRLFTYAISGHDFCIHLQSCVGL